MKNMKCVVNGCPCMSAPMLSLCHSCYGFYYNESKKVVVNPYKLVKKYID